MMTIEEEMILNRVATALETIARQKMGAEPVKADEELEDVYADEVLEWMDKFPPEMRDCIRATAYHFINVGIEWKKEQIDEGKAMLHVADKSYKIGWRDCKYEMMKDAVDGEVVKTLDGSLRVSSDILKRDGFKFGDRVRIIILPKED